jgi:hypothetical protein
MSVQAEPFSIVFPDWFDDRAAFEHEGKGYLGDVEVHLADGRLYRLFFMDPVRLAQDLEEYVKLGKPYLSEPNLVVVPAVTTPAIRAAVAGLLADGAFAHFRSCPLPSTNHSPGEE